MPRNKKHRTIKCNPAAYYYKPQSIPLSALEEVILEIDELESLRLADFLANSHEQASVKMKISRATFGRIIESARHKVVDAILNGKAIRIGNEFPEGLKERRKTRCKNCSSPHNTTTKKNACCKCKKTNKEN